jgi:hypothetical protein
MAIYNNTSAKQICQQIATQKEENKTNNFLEVKLCSTILPVVLFIQTLENTERAIKKGQSRETGNIGYTRRRKTKQKHNTICIGHHYVRTNTNNVNKTCVLLQTTGGKDEPKY